MVYLVVGRGFAGVDMSGGVRRYWEYTIKEIVTKGCLMRFCSDGGVCRSIEDTTRPGKLIRHKCGLLSVFDVCNYPLPNSPQVTNNEKITSVVTTRP